MKHSKKHWLFVPLLMIVVGGSALTAWWHGQSSTNVVDYGSKSVNAVLGSETSLVDWQTQYFTTKVGSNLHLLTSNESGGPAILGSYVYTSNTARDADQLAVTIGQLHDYTLNEISAVKVRANNPTDYTKSSRNFGPTGAIVYSRISSYETAVFWQHGGRYAAVVVSGSANRQANLEQTLSDVVSNWQWR